MMQLGCDGGQQYNPILRYQRQRNLISSFRGFGHFLGAFSDAGLATNFDESFIPLQSGDPAKRARAIVQAVSTEPSTACRSYH